MAHQTKVMCVYRRGGDYNIKHVIYLKEQIPEIICLGIDIPLLYDWRGWWAKMELFRPDIEGDILFFDLDTIVKGSIEKYKNLSTTHFLEDFFHPDKSIGSGMMYIKHEDKAKVWNEWIKSPAHHMAKFRGDQDFLKQFFWGAKRWQHEFPKEVISYKKHLVAQCQFYEHGYNLNDANVVCFHGQPRPWAAPEDWIKEIYNKRKSNV